MIGLRIPPRQTKDLVCLSQGGDAAEVRVRAGEPVAGDGLMGDLMEGSGLS